ncbi:twin-arginine translocation signal domain-containing protein [Natrinema sp. CBA1119]|uniref:twin-arginine translocation signal domain-containing protein n=1 Tax=Natrinema sp. CBA1119 TaxID=1608465 RepID=UPI001145BAE6|nr:twin-arginine translocation signal domain-containing protein [Natrinema sp. CBA1119]
MPNRRQFIRGVTATAALSGTGIVSASNPEEEDLASKIFHAYVKGGPDLVGRLLDKDGIAHTQTTTKVGSFDSDKNDSQIGTASNHYTESDSELNVIFSELSEYNRILCTVNMKLDGVNSSVRSPTFVPDVIGVGFDENVWTTVGTPNVQAMAMSDDGYHDAEFWPGSIDGGGLAAEVHLDWGPNGGGLPPTSYISLQCELVTNGTAGTIWGSYKHTWSWDPIGGAIKSITGGGPIGVDLDAGTSVLWDEMIPEDPEPALP